MDAEYPNNKISEYQKFSARNELKLNQVRYDYQVKIDNGFDSDSSDKFSWPIKSELPIPFDELVNLCGHTSGTFYERG